MGTQWVGLDGAPETFTLSGHTPVGNNVGLGMNVTQDEIFITNETYVDIDFSYKINLSDEAKLALGFKAGGHFLTIDTNMLKTKHFDENAANNNSFATAKERVNFYLMAGKTFDLNADLKFKPSTLLKMVDGAPIQVDLSANFLIKEKLTLGAA